MSMFLELAAFCNYFIKNENSNKVLLRKLVSPPGAATEQVTDVHGVIIQMKNAADPYDVSRLRSPQKHVNGPSPTSPVSPLMATGAVVVSASSDAATENESETINGIPLPPSPPKSPKREGRQAKSPQLSSPSKRKNKNYVLD